MPGVPWLPGGQANLPAERFILFADTTNLVLRVDETQVTRNGVNFTGDWQSGVLNQVREGHVFQLISLELFYAALAATTISVSASGDGGENWGTPVVLTIPITTGRIARARADFDEAIGIDVRFRLEFDTNDLINVFGYRPHLVERGDLIF